MPAFQPLFRNPHLQTIAGHFWTRSDECARFPIERRWFQTDPGVQVLLESQRPAAECAGEIVLLHGMEGSGDSGYMRGLAGSALLAGLAAHRLQTRAIYHGGLTADLLAVLRQLRTEGRPPAFLVGFSLGGNVALKLAGELGDAAAGLMRGVAAVSTPLDLAACARRIAQPENRLYQRRFVRRMRARLRAEGLDRKRNFAHLNSVMAIDDAITAPSFGFSGAAEYYRTQSAVRYLDAIRVPVLLIQAKDDTFVPFEIFESEAVRRNAAIELLATEHGGHLGFLGRKPHRFWAEEIIVEWMELIANR